ncbi:MAG TPA: hypothetical protein VKS79_22910 [Gemmataceae bacterium]|nr:hypothetical protein [Gemmataceae bacterium]
MKARSNANSNHSLPPALNALRRAAKKAVGFARRTGTPAYVLEGGKIVDIASRPAKKPNKRHR